MALIALTLTGCHDAATVASGTKELNAFSSFAKSLPGVIDVARVTLKTDSGNGPFEGPATGYATVVLDPKAWRGSIAGVASSIYERISEPKGEGRMTVRATIYAAGNRLLLGYDRATNARGVAAMIAGTEFPGVAWVGIFVATDELSHDAPLIVIGRAPGSDLAEVLREWLPLAVPLSTSAQLVVTTDAASAIKPLEISGDAVAVPDVPIHQVQMPVASPISASAIAWLAELDSLPLVIGYDADAKSGRDPATRGELHSTTVYLADAYAKYTVEPVLRQSPTFAAGGIVTFNWDDGSDASGGVAGG